MLDPLANDIQRPLEPAPAILRGDVHAGTDEHLLEDRLRGLRAVAKQAVVGRHLAPSEQRLPFFLGDARDQFLDAIAIGFLAREEDEPGAIAAFGRERERHRLAQERVRRLNENPGAVTGIGLAAARAAVLQVDEDLQCLADDVVRSPALDVYDKAHTAGVVLGAGVCTDPVQEV